MHKMLSRRFLYSQIFVFVVTVLCCTPCKSTHTDQEIQGSSSFSLLDLVLAKALHPFILPAKCACEGINLSIGFSSQEMKNLVIIDQQDKVSEAVKNCCKILFARKNMEEFKSAEKEGKMLPEHQIPTTDEAVNQIILKGEVPGLNIRLCDTTKWFFKKFFTKNEQVPPFFNIEELTNTQQTMIILSFLKLADNPIFRQVLWALLVYRHWVQTSRPIEDGHWSQLLEKHQLEELENNWKQAHTIKFQSDEGFGYIYDTGSEHILTLAKLDQEEIRIKDLKALSLPTWTNQADRNDPIKPLPIPFELALAHELLHVLHFLMNPYRFKVEQNINMQGNFDIYGNFSQKTYTKKDFSDRRQNPPPAIIQPSIKHTTNPVRSPIQKQSQQNCFPPLQNNMNPYALQQKTNMHFSQQIKSILVKKVPVLPPMPENVMSPMIDKVGQPYAEMFSKLWFSRGSINFNEYRVIMGEPFQRDNVLGVISENILRMLWKVGIRVGLDKVPKNDLSKEDQNQITKVIKEYVSENFNALFEYYFPTLN